jgi:polysaccharide deacetylase 2 family uncharacterized protein YibQ
VATDDLDAPLAPRAPKKRIRLPVRIPHLIAALLLLCVGVFVGWAVLVDDPFGGEPMVIVAANSRSSLPPKKAETPPAPDAGKPNPNPSASPMPVDPPAETPGDGKTVTIIDGLTGKRQEVKVNQTEPRGNANTPASTAIDQKTLEMSRHGTIPKIGPDGARPSEIYAHPVKPDAKPNAPRVAIIVGGLGIGANTTSEALAKLPGPVSFAFAPYGTDLPRWVARARGEGHDVLLQVPMEPFDYPDSDPGPQTLLVGLDTNQNIDRLHWFLSRFQGYVGIVNDMGARFTATEAAITPIVREAARRGLIYFDDGSSPRSQASQIAGANNVAFAKADVVIDSVPSQADIDRALTRLEQLARQRGSAVGVAGALPVTIDRIAQWVKAAEQRGILLVPISALANKPKSSS